MPRRNLPRRVRSAIPSPAEGVQGWARAERGPDGEWLVRTVPGERAAKCYRCPGCDHEIGPGIAHVVAWPAAEQGSAADRRHWHTECWSARTRRAPTRRHW